MSAGNGPGPTEPRASAATLLLRVGAALLCLLALLGGGPLGLLVTAGLLALAGGTTALLRGRSRVLRIPGRRAAIGVLAAGLATVLVGGGALGATRPAAAPGSAVPTVLAAPVAPAVRAAGPTTAAIASPATPVASSERPTRRATRPAATTNATAGTAIALLATLPVKGKAPLTGYARTADFGTAWLDVDRNGCDTRDDVLRRDLTTTTGAGCRVLSGDLHDPYTGTSIAFVRGLRTSTAVQIDHVVALANAWRTGGQKLSQAQRIALANDPVNLFAVDGPTNEAKGDGDAATWLPPVKAFRCTYVAHQIAVKAAYGLWITPAERAAMARVLGACPAIRAPHSTTARPVPATGSTSSAPLDAPSGTQRTASAPAVRHRYANCAAVRAAGKAPLRRGQPGYRAGLDRNGDGVACETAVARAPVTRPTTPRAQTSTAPSGATAVCRDGSYSFSQHHSGTCSRHGGVERWL